MGFEEVKNKEQIEREERAEILSSLLAAAGIDGAEKELEEARKKFYDKFGS